MSEMPPEGTLRCRCCDMAYMVIAGIPILCESLESYLESRYSVGVQMMRLCRSGTLRETIKASLPPGPEWDQRGASERRWAAIYAAESRAHLYDHIHNTITLLKSESVLEHGCGVGSLTSLLTQSGLDVVGVDSSFPALVMARRRDPRTLYVLADSTSIRTSLFDAVVSLNMLEIVEPLTLLDVMASQSRRYLVVADPYDYARGDRTVKKPLDPAALRDHLSGMGFCLIGGIKQSYVPWRIRIGPRVSLRYLVDVVVAKKI